MAHIADPIRNSVAALLGCVATLGLCAMQFGDRSGLNNMSFAQVQAFVSDLGKAQRLAKQGNIESLADKLYRVKRSACGESSRTRIAISVIARMLTITRSAPSCVLWPGVLWYLSPISKARFTSS